MPTDKIVVGLTGAFGSGCTTAARHLRDSRKFELLTLSDALRKIWREKNKRKEAQRQDLQKLGDELRESRGAGILVDLALDDLDQKYKGREEPTQIVVDGIRNLGEIQRLQDLYGYRFTLIAVLATFDDRWDRIGSSAYVEHGLTRSDFIADDQRDT